MTGVEHFEARLRVASEDLARVLKEAALNLNCEAGILADGGSVTTNSARLYIRDVEHALLNYDKAKAALEAVRAVG